MLLTTGADPFTFECVVAYSQTDVAFLTDVKQASVVVRY